MSLQWGRLTPDRVEQWAALTNLLAEADGTDEFYAAADLAEELVEDGVDPALDTVGAWADGQLVGYGQLRMAAGELDGHAPAWLGGGVAPAHRGQGIGRHIMDVLEDRASVLAADRHPGRPLLLRASGLLEGAPVRSLLDHRGYVLARYFHDMRRADPEPLALAGLPAVQGWNPDSAELVRLAHNEAFAGHWGSTPNPPGRWRDLIQSHTFRPDLSFINLAADGEVDAYTVVRTWVEGEAYVDLVGVRPRARHRGLARACLGASVNAALAAGFDRIELSVDTENGQGAGGLYASLGFQVVRTTATYTKVVPAR